MVKIKDESVLGFIVGEIIVCRKCVTEDEKSEVYPDEIISDLDYFGDYRFCCDRCKKEFV